MYHVQVVSKEKWKEMSFNAHKIAFREITDPEAERIDYALLCTDSKGKLCNYVTVREIDAGTCYWAYGGAFPPAKKSVKAFYAFREMVNWASERYDNMLTYIENDNIPMLKMAMQVGFKITGIRNYKGSVLLEHHLETGRQP